MGYLYRAIRRRIGVAKRIALLKLAEWVKAELANGDDLYVAIVQDDYGHEPTPKQQQYWFEDGTCPRNTLRYTELIVLKSPDEDDPCLDVHGLFDYVGCMPLPEPQPKPFVATTAHDYQSYYRIIKPLMDNPYNPEKDN
jgi:hypothetical protein